MARKWKPAGSETGGRRFVPIEMWRAGIPGPNLRVGVGRAICGIMKRLGFTCRGRIRLLLVAIGVLGSAAGCANVYYDALEKVGVAKRELLADRVEDTQEAQEEAKEEFVSALEQLMALTGETGGDLKKHYDRLADALEASEERAETVHNRIGGVRKVAEALFEEWEEELGQYTSSTLRQRSERQLDETRRRYDRLVLLMQRAADRMEPVLATLRDQVLFLKHNLNAQAVAGLGATADALQADVEALITDMEASIAEAETFLASWKT